MEYLGHSKVRLLDGDWQSWSAAGGPSETEVPEVAEARFVPHFQPDRLAEIDQVKQWVAGSDMAIMDARTEGEYTGSTIHKGNPRGGHVPGAIHLNWEDLRTADGRFKKPGQLRAMFEELGLKPDEPVVTYCNSGARAAAEAFALELAGFKNVRNYYCSFQQWSADEHAPLEEGKVPLAAGK